MTHRLRKEILFLLPAWLLATVMPVAGFLCFGRLQHLFNGVLLFFAFFTALLGAASFGNEFNHGTMSLLLSQPATRRRLWHEKTLVLGAALASVAAVFAACTGLPLRLYPLFLLPPICALCAGPYLSLVLRNTIAAACASVVAQATLLVAGGMLTGDAPRDSTISAPMYAYLVGVLLVYSGFCYARGYAVFQSLEEVGPRRLAVGIPPWVRAPRGWRARVWRRPPFGAGWCLVVKELHIHRLSVMLAAGLGAAFLVHVATSTPGSGSGAGVFKNAVFIYGLIAPVLIGAAAVAEERHLGVIEWQLTLPPAARTQWAVKIGTTYVLMLVLGILLPWSLLRLQPLFSPQGDLARFHVTQNLMLALLGTTVALAASSAAKNTLGAFILGFGTVFVAMFGHDWLLGQVIHNRGLAGLILANRWASTRLVFGVATLGCFALTMHLAWSNYRYAETGRHAKVLQPAVVVLGVAATLGLMIVL